MSGRNTENAARVKGRKKKIQNQSGLRFARFSRNKLKQSQNIPPGRKRRAKFANAKVGLAETFSCVSWKRNLQGSTDTHCRFTCLQNSLTIIQP